MRIGIVCSEASKFTPAGEAQAKQIIHELLSGDPNHIISSGHCHLGGIDIWAEEIADELDLTKAIFAPSQLNWTGYKERNIKIAVFSDIVHCISVDRLPEGYRGMRFSHCYHCNSTDHVKSGGCWTMHRAKQGKLHIVRNYPDE